MTLHKTKTIGITLLFVGLALLVLWYLFVSPRYETVAVEKGLAIQGVYATGEVEPVYWSKISATLPGRISEVMVREDQSVRKGEVLARLEDRVERAQLEELNAQLQFLEKETERQRKLQAQAFASRQKFERAQSAHQVVLAEIKSQKQLLERMTISSPMDGVVLRRDIEPGEYVKSGELIMWVGLTRPLRITADVDEEDIPFVRKGQKVLIKADAFGQEVFEGTVNKITPKGDPVSKNFRVRIALPDDTRLLIGMTAEINIVIQKQKNALLIPKSSVFNNSVWIVRNRSISKHPVKIGIEGEEKLQILEGVSLGDQVLRYPQDYLNIAQ